MKKYRMQLLYFLAIMAMLLGACSENEEIREKETFTVSFVVDGQVVEEQEIACDELVKRIEDPVSEETFVGWFIKVDDYMTQYNFKSPVRKNLTLYAEWESSGYTVTYMLNKEEMDDIIVRVPKGTEAPLLQLKTEEEELKAWCIDAELEHEYDLSLINAPLVLYAKWKRIVEPDEPVVLIAECENGEFGNGATLDGGNGSASGGNAVNIGSKGYVKVRFDIPKAGSYQVAVTYLTWAQGATRPSKINKIEIPGVLAQTEVDFVGTDKFETINIGVHAFTEGTVEVILSASWGWTIFDKVTLTEKPMPAEVSAEFEAGVLDNGAYLENVQGGASGGNAVCLGQSGRVAVKLTTPKTASYKIMVRYFGWSGQNKKNYIEVSGVLPRQECTFIGTNNYAELSAGIIDLTAGQEVEVIASASWGWTYFDKVTLVEVEKPISVTVECETGLLGNGAKLEIPKPGASGENAVNIGQSGNVRLKVVIPKTATYKFTVRYFTWQADKKLNKVAIPGILTEHEYNFVGTNNYENLEIADVDLPEGEVEIELSASWGWTYFDKIILEEIVL